MNSKLYGKAIWNDMESQFRILWKGYPEAYEKAI